MGAALSNVIDESTKREVEDLIKAVLETFTTEYVKAYGIAMFQKAKMDAEAEPREQRLEEREGWKENRLEGWLQKEGGFRGGKWQKRYFVIRHDYFIDWYVSEEEAKKGEKGKKKGTMALCGYNIIDDVNNGILNRIKRLADKMGVDVSSFPQPKEYPPFTFEVHHDRRKSWFLTCKDQEEFKKWLDEFQTCARRVYGLRNKEWVHEQAFHTAVRKTRWSLGRWGWWTYGGSEEQILSDLIVSELDYDVMSKLYAKIPRQAPHAVRNKMQGAVDKFLDGLVMSAVTPAWKGMSTTVDALRPKVEPTIKELADPLGKLEKELVDKIREAVMSVLGPAIESHITPHLARPIDIIRVPLREAFDESRKIFTEHVAEQEGNLMDEAGREKAFHHLDYLPWSWQMWRATDKFDGAYDALWDLRTVFTDIYPWSIMWRARDVIRKTTDNAVYTYEKKLKEGGGEINAESSGRARDAVMEDYVFDCQITTSQLCEELIKTIILPPFNNHVRPAVKSLLEPLEATIPDAMKQFVDIYKLFDQVVDDVIHHSILVAMGDEKIERHGGGSSSSKGKAKEIESGDTGKGKEIEVEA